MAWVCAFVSEVLGRTCQQKHYPRFFNICVGNGLLHLTLKSLLRKIISLTQLKYHVMKKLFLLLTLICCANIVFAQYKVGDVYEKNGVKGVIFHVDKTGEQALAITVSEKDNIDKWYQMQEEFKTMSKAAKKEYKNEVKNVENSIKTHFEKLASSTSAYGANNMKVIKEYCAKHNIDMNKYFPTFVWAESLGDGWFIPGTHEADLYAEYIAFGVGKGSYKGTNKKDITNKYNRLNTELKSNNGYENLNLPVRITTSSIGRNSMDLYGVKASSWCIYKSLELREEQANVAGFSVRSNCYYDIDAYRPMMGMGTWVSYCNVAVCVVNTAETKQDAGSGNLGNVKVSETAESSVAQ